MEKAYLKMRSMQKKTYLRDEEREWVGGAGLQILRTSDWAAGSSYAWNHIPDFTLTRANKFLGFLFSFLLVLFFLFVCLFGFGCVFLLVWWISVTVDPENPDRESENSSIQIFIHQLSSSTLLYQELVSSFFIIIYWGIVASVSGTSLCFLEPAIQRKRIYPKQTSGRD